MNRKVNELTVDNQSLVDKILELKDEQARTYNEANQIYLEAKRMKYVSLFKSLTFVDSKAHKNRRD